MPSLRDRGIAGALGDSLHRCRGLRFYDRREIKDLLAYLRLLVNPADVSLRVINVPKRGIGKTTIQRLTDAANQLGIPLWDVVSDPEAVRSGGRSARGLLQFCDLVNDLKARSRDVVPSELIQQVMEKSGYVSELIADGTDEAEERRRNLQELANAALQYQEENEEGDLEDSWPQRPCPAMPTARRGR